MARPTLRNEEINRKIDEAAALGCSVEEIAFYAGVHRDTMYDWMKKDPELSDRIHELWERQIIRARQTIMKSIETNSDDAKWLLERKRKNEFSPRTEHTGADGKDLNSPLSEEDKARLDKLLYGEPTAEQPKPAEPAIASDGAVRGDNSSGGDQSAVSTPAEGTPVADAPAPAERPQAPSSGAGSPGDEGGTPAPVQ